MFGSIAKDCVRIAVKENCPQLLIRNLILILRL